MGILQAAGIMHVYHFMPLHYLPYVARSQLLLSKLELEKRGFGEEHFRSTSRKQDRDRGFANAVHTTPNEYPELLLAKLEAGFPHIGLEMPVAGVEAFSFDLCRYNIAKMRAPRSDGNGGLMESGADGRYYGHFQVPIAREVRDQRAMLRKHLGKRVIEILFEGRLPIPPASSIVAYSPEDATLARTTLHSLNAPWPVLLRPSLGSYARRTEYAVAVTRELYLCAMNDAWRGSGLEFDRLHASS